MNYANDTVYVTAEGLKEIKKERGNVFMPLRREV